MPGIVYPEGKQVSQANVVEGIGQLLPQVELTRQRPSLSTGQRVVSSQAYDNRGQSAYTAVPYEISGVAGSGYVAPTWTNLTSYRRYFYDEPGRLVRIELWSQNSRQWYTEDTFDGWQRQHTDENSHQTDFLLDGFGRLAQVTEHNTGGATYTTQYGYDHRDNLTQVTDAASNVTTLSYDLLGRKTAMTDPDMGSWSYGYDGMGNLVSQTDGRGWTLAMAYDGLNRLTEKRKDSPTGALLAEYGYDGSGQKGLLSNSKAYGSAGTVQVYYTSYDARNRLTQKLWTIPGSGGGAFRMAWGYDEANHVTSVRYPANIIGMLGETVQRNYNPVGQLDQVVSQSDNTHYVASTLYNADGQAWLQRFDQNSNGADRRFNYYTANRRLVGQQAGQGGSTTNLQNLAYNYDARGNITNLVDHINSSQQQCFEYDQLDRLTKAFTGSGLCSAYSATGAGPYDHDYSYDAIGNLTGYDGVSYTYSGSQPHAVTAAHSNSYSYDSNGNQTGRTIGGTAYSLTYDYENRLTEVKQGSTTLATFTYDADGNRVKGTVGGVNTVYLAGLYEYQAGGSTKYYEGHNGVVSFRRAGYASNNGIFYILKDHLQSTATIINQAGVVQTSHYYYPFGGNRGGVQSSLTNKHFTGQYHETSLPGGEGLYFYNARWYDAQLGRFTQADTLVPNPGNPQDLNRFSYVRNNPIQYLDPTGNVPIDPNRNNPPGPKTSEPLPAPGPPSSYRRPAPSPPSWYRPSLYRQNPYRTIGSYFSNRNSIISIFRGRTGSNKNLT